MRHRGLFGLLGAAGVFLTVPALVLAGESVDLAVDTDVVRVDAEAVQDRLGVRLAVCDVDGDGIDDLVIGADQATGPDGRPNAGSVSVVLGRRGSWSGAYAIGDIRRTLIHGEDAFDRLGRGVGCADVDGDGDDDMLLGAPRAKGPGEARLGAGQVHVVLGDPALPDVLDLLLADETVIYGARGGDPGDGLGYAPRGGDVDGDGIADILADAASAFDRSGTATAAGRLHVLFGRAQWPASVDLADGADVVIYGAESYDELASNVGTGDLDGDGMLEILTVARLADGLGNQRDGAGEIHVFAGRSSWPATIDLAVEDASTTIMGPDPGDQAGAVEGLDVGDLDGDSTMEILAGVGLSDGVLNQRVWSGEARTFELEEDWPPYVDLRSMATSIVYGAESGDFFCRWLKGADLDGDRIHDLACAASGADGPAGERNEAGEVAVVLGRSAFPEQLDLAVDDADIRVFGAEPNDRLVLLATPDLNGDGVFELAMSAAVDSATRPSSIWIASPIDTDQDGIAQLTDNCPLVANPDQADGDADRRGDACQGDWDGDQLVDEDDCAPEDPSGGLPPEVVGLAFDAGSTTRLSWHAASFADRYDVARGDLDELDGVNYGNCRTASDPDPTDTSFVDSDVPVAGRGFHYLVRAWNARCRVRGSWGENSAGSGRMDDAADPCPDE